MTTDRIALAAITALSAIDDESLESRVMTASLGAIDIAAELIEDASYDLDDRVPARTYTALTDLITALIFDRVAGDI